jgi:hypothetical protein
LAHRFRKALDEPNPAVRVLAAAGDAYRAFAAPHGDLKG